VQQDDLVVALAGAPVSTLNAFRSKLIEIRLAQSALASIRRGAYIYNVTVAFSHAP
jgi:hypothetical protein